MDATETFRLLEAAAQALRRGQRCAMATVVGVEGSAYRHEGARMLVFEDGTTAGAISGGCLETDVVEAARQAMKTGEPQLLRYDMTSEDDELWGLGTGCNGVVEVFVWPLAPEPAPLEEPSLQEPLPGQFLTEAARRTPPDPQPAVQPGPTATACG